MNMLFVWARRIALIGALALGALAVIEWIAQSMGASLLGNAYPAGRLLEFGAILMVFAAGLLLREVLTELRQQRG